MTKDKVIEQAFNIVLDSYKILELAKRKDKDIFDILYNWVDRISLNAPSLIKKIKDFAVESKRNILDPKVVQLAKDLAYGNVSYYVTEAVSKAVPDLLEKELHLSSYDARQLWLEIDKKVLDETGFKY